MDNYHILMFVGVRLQLWRETISDKSEIRDVSERH